MSKSLSLVTTATPLPDKTQLARFQKATIEALRFIEKSDIVTTRRKVVIGFALHCIKASVKHGAWLPWLKANVQGKAYAQVNYYMRAATACAEKMKLGAPDLLTLPQTKINALTLDVKADDHFHAKVAKFCGELTFNELLDKHGIKETKKLGGARTAGDATAAPIDPEELAANTREELGAYIAQGRQLLIEENICQRLPADDIRAFDASAEALLADWRKANAAILKK